MDSADSWAGVGRLQDSEGSIERLQQDRIRIARSISRLERSIKRGFYTLLDLVKLVDEILETEKKHDELIKEILQDEAEKQSKADFLKPRFDWPDDE